MPFGGSKSADDFESGTAAAACGGTTTVIDFAIQPTGGALAQGLADWHGKAEGKAAIDYAFHMIVRSVTPEVERDGHAREAEGVTSFKLFTAYPGVFMVDDASIFRALQRTGENGGLICMHAENGGVIDVLIEQALKARPHRPQVPRAHPTDAARGRGDEPRDRARRSGPVPVYIVHLPPRRRSTEVREARHRGVAAYAETCPQYLFLSYDNYAGRASPARST